MPELESRPSGITPAGILEPRERPKPQVTDHELIRRIGGGAYGEVWLAKNVVGTFRAVKVVYRDSFKDSGPYEREYRGIQKFEPISRSNDGFVDILQIGRNDLEGYYYCVMELADAAEPQGSNQCLEGSHQQAVTRDQISASKGRSACGGSLNGDPCLLNTYQPKTLRSEIQHRGRLPCEECLQFALSLNLALGHLHRHGLIHRDIKPSNIIFVGGIPKLADIGLVAEVEQARSFVGTEGFIPPEGPNSPQADIYSLGKVLYEMSMGKDRLDFPEPFTALGQADGSQELEELNVVILKACATQPSDRYQTAEEMHLDLALLQSGRSVKWKRVVENRLAFARKVGAVVGLVAALAIAGYLYQRHQTREVKRVVARMQIQNAENLFERGDPARALALLAQVLRRDPDNRVAGERIMAAITQRNFPRLATKPQLHEARPIIAHFSPDGQSIVSASEDHLVRIWNAHTGEETISPKRHSDRVTSVEFSPDGSKVVSASNDCTVQVWDALGGAPLFPPLMHDGSVNAATFDPSGRFIATAASDSMARIYSAETGQLIHSLAHEGKVNSVTFSPHGQWLATASEDESVRVWQVGSGQLKERFPQAGMAELVRFSGDSKWLAATLIQDKASGIWRVQAWDLTARPPLTRSIPHDQRIYTLAFDPESKRLVTASADNVARVWQLATGEALFQLQHSANVRAASFSPDGHRLLTASVDSTARLWDATTGAPISEPLLHAGRVIHAEFSPDGGRVLTASWDKTVKLWEVRPLRPSSSTLSHDQWIVSAEFDASGRHAIIATGQAVFTANVVNTWNIGGPHAVGVWDVAAGVPISSATLPLGTEAVAAQFTQTGPKALIADRPLTRAKALRADKAFSRQGRIWDLASGTTTGEAIQHEAALNCAYFSLDGILLATGSIDGTARVWDARGLPLTPFLTHKERINSVRFSPDSATLITASNDRTAIIWDAVSGRRVASLLGHEAEVWFAQFSPKGDKVVTISSDHTAKIWSTNGALIATLQHDWALEYAEFSPDGAKVVTAAWNTVHIWNAVTGKQLIEEPLRHAELVMTARFSPDGLRVITASLDRTAQVWDAATGLKLGEPFRHSERVISAGFSSDGRHAITASLDGTARIWQLPIAASPGPSWLPELAEAVGGRRLSRDRISEAVSWTEYTELKARLTKLPGTDPYIQWAQRFFADPAMPSVGADAHTQQAKPAQKSHKP